MGQSFQGWITFGSEFQLYERRQDVGHNYDRTCYSGIFDTLRHHKAAARFDGQYVRILATPLSTREYFGDTLLDGRVENYCARDLILIAHAITALPPPR